jgi:hypothetical protein
VLFFRSFEKNTSFGAPRQTVKKIDAVDQNRGLVVADVGRTKRLPHAVGRRNDIAIHHRDRDAFVFPPGNEGLVEIRQAEENALPLPPEPIKRMRNSRL